MRTFPPLSGALFGLLLASCALSNSTPDPQTLPVDIGPGPNLKMEESSTGSFVILPPGHKSGEHYPTLFLLPYAGNSAADLFNQHYREGYAALMKRHKLIIVLPESASSAPAASGEDERPDPVERTEQKIQWDIERWGMHYGVDRSKIILAGFDGGADLAWTLTQRQPARYAGAIVMGCRCGYRGEKVLDQLAAAGLRYFIARGEGDDRAHLSAAMTASIWLDGSKVSHKLVNFPGAHVPAPADVFMNAVDFVLGGDASEGQPELRPPPPAPSPRSGAGSPAPSAPAPRAR